jgi:small-conductance mechanosensitive channel
MDDKEFDRLVEVSIEKINNAAIPDDMRSDLLGIIETARQTNDNNMVVQTVLQAELSALHLTTQETCDSLCNYIIKLSRKVNRLEKEIEELKQQRIKELNFELQVANSEIEIREQIAELNSDFAKNLNLKGE